MDCIHAIGPALLAILSEKALSNIGLVVVVLALVVASLSAYRLWNEMHEDLEPATTDELLAPFDGAYAAGEHDDEEYERLRQHLPKARLPASVSRPGKGNPPKGPSAPES